MAQSRSALTTATFNFTAGIIDGGGQHRQFIVRKKDSGTWTSPTVGTKTARVLKLPA